MKNWSSICPKMSFDSIPAAVQTGKSDFAAGCITITDEQEESINRFRKGMTYGPREDRFHGDAVPLRRTGMRRTMRRKGCRCGSFTRILYTPAAGIS